MKRSITAQAAAFVEAARFEYGTKAETRAAILAKLAAILAERNALAAERETITSPAQDFAGIGPAPSPDASSQNSYEVSYEPVPLRTVPPLERRAKRMPKEIAYTGSRGYRLCDVGDGKIRMEAFLAQLSDEDLICLTRGEGMCSPKVTPGTAAAFGGVTDRLLEFGIPLGCCSDGPSGIRMDSGAKAFSMPSGTCLACTWNHVVVKELYNWEGLELRKNRIDSLLGPGMNIHRHPLNGRNFEYFSEDPLITGKMAVMQLRGMRESMAAGTIKHFCGNNQEYRRHKVDSVISERALREIYLRGFEIAVREGAATSVMTTYGSVNGAWTASQYDLLTTILRGQFGFGGIVMTDWWAAGSEENGPDSIQQTSSMIRAQNDLYMVTANAEKNTNGDDTAEGLSEGRITRAELQRAAYNICRFLIDTPAYLRMYGRETELDKKLEKVREEEEQSSPVDIKVHAGKTCEIPSDLIRVEKGTMNTIEVQADERGRYLLEMEDPGWTTTWRRFPWRSTSVPTISIPSLSRDLRRSGKRSRSNCRQ